MILLIDNYDSFTYNLVDYFQQLGVNCKVVRNHCPIEELPEDIRGVVLSPGPGRPQEAGRLMQYIEHFHDKLPMLGICLGHQALGMYFGAPLALAPTPMHGKISEISLDNTSVPFLKLPKKVKVTRYHSLILSQMPENLKATAYTDDGLVMAMQHQHLPIYGLQFHPEAICTAEGLQMLENWVQSIGYRP